MTTPTPSQRTETSIARTAVLLAALAGALAWNVLQIGAPADEDALAAPPLTLPEARCNVASTDPQELEARSTQLAAAGHAGIERYPFRPSEGLASLALLLEASACAGQAGADAGGLDAQAQRFRRQLEIDYRDRLLRVERALVDGLPERARTDIEVLAAQLEDEDHPFALRMRNLRTELADDETK